MRAHAESHCCHFSSAPIRTRERAEVQCIGRCPPADHLTRPGESTVTAPMYSCAGRGSRTDAVKGDAAVTLSLRLAGRAAQDHVGQGHRRPVTDQRQMKVVVCVARYGSSTRSIATT